MLIFVSGMLVKHYQSRRLDITLACVLCKSTLRTSFVIGGHAPPTKLLGGGGGNAPPSSATPATSLKDYFYH